MSIVDEVFKNASIDFGKLVEYGFIYEHNKYVYCKKIFNDEFSIIVIVNRKGNVESKLINNEFNDEYVNINIELFDGLYVNKVRNEYIKALNDIKFNCCSINKFCFDQSNSLVKYIKSKYNVDPEFLWDDTPYCGVFRNKNNKKWFAIIMNVDKSKINNDTGDCEIVNVKVNNKRINELLSINGIYKAYHMNKNNWITIILDNTVKDDYMYNLIDESFNIINK